MTPADEVRRVALQLAWKLENYDPNNGPVWNLDGKELCDAAKLLRDYPAPSSNPSQCISVPREHFMNALNYILHCGANQIMRGQPHPQQQIVDALESALAAAPQAKEGV